MPQGTIKSYDHADGSLVLMTDGLKELSAPAGALAKRTNTLELRFGQRVRYTVEKRDGEDVIANVQILTL